MSSTRPWAILLAGAACAAGCASRSDNIAPAYVSPIVYENYSCAQIAQEAQIVSQRAAQVAGVQDNNAAKDAVITTVAVIVFWPIALANHGDGQVAAQLAALKGQMDALQQASIRKQCGIRFEAATK